MAKRFLLYIICAAAPLVIVGLATTYWNGSKPSDGAANEGEPRPAALAPPADGSRPSLALAENEFDFGVVAPGSVNEHTFVLENRGDGPLSLQAGDTSCKCTLSELEETRLAPGTSTGITLTWHAGQPESQPQRQFALIETNDPEHPEISLAVTGLVRDRLSLDPPQLVATRLDPDRPIALSTVISSQVYEDFEVTDVRSNLPGLEFRTEPVPPARLEEMQATSARRLIVTLPPAEAGAKLKDQLTLTIRSDADDQTHEEAVVLDAEVLSRIAVFGSRLDADRGLDLGVVTQGERAEQRLIVRVRGEPSDVPIQVLETRPDCLRATLEDYKPDEGIYRLAISIDPEAEPVTFLPTHNMGYVTIGSPDDPSLRKQIPVQGQVLPPLK